MRLKRYIENLTDRKVNDDIYIKDKVVYVNNGEHEYKYQFDEWYIKAGDNWVNLQGGIPVYESDIEDDIFEKENEDAIEEIE